MHLLRQSTASQEVPAGPFVDAADGATLEDGLHPIAASDIKLWKHAGTSMANASAASTAFMVDGTYLLTLDATDTDTLGPLVIVLTPAGARPMRIECLVLPALVFDSLQANTGIAADLRAVIGDLGSAANISHFANTIGTCVVGATPSTTTQVVITTLFGLTPPEMFTIANQVRGKKIKFTTNGSNQDGIVMQEARIAASTTPAGDEVVLTVEPPLALAPFAGDIAIIMDGELAEVTATRFQKVSVEELNGSAQALLHLKRMGLASASGTLAAGSTQTVLQLATITPSLSGVDQLRGRVVLFTDEAGTPAAIKIQGGRIQSNSTTALTLEQPLNASPAAGTVFIVV